MFYILLLGAFFCPLIHVWFDSKYRNPHGVTELYLMYSLFFIVGLGGFFAFLEHSFAAEETAKFVGWPGGNPFQLEVGFASLAFGVLGILAPWKRGNFWTAIVIGETIFLWGAAFGHIKDMLVNLNYAPGNAGILLYADIFIPVVLITLYFLHAYLRRRAAN